MLFSSFANTTASNYFKSYTVSEKTVTVSTPGSISSSSGDYYCGVMSSTPSNNNANYIELTVTGATIKSVSILITGNGSNKTCQPALLGWEGSIESNTTADHVLVPDAKKISNKGLSNAQWHQFDVHGNDLTRVRIYRAVKNVSVAGAAAQQYGNAQTLQFYGISVELEGLTPVCPSGLTISSKDNKIAFTEGDAIELTAALSAGNGDISYQWYKGSVAPENAISGATNAKYQVASCTTADEGDYFCVASKTSCDDAVNASAFAITVAADTKCFNMPAITSKPSNLASVTVTGGTLSDVSVNGKSVSMDGNGLKFGGNDSRLKVTLTGASIVEGTKITVAWKGASAGSAGVGLFNENLASQVISFSGGEAAGSVSHTFTAEEAANYADEFIINRNASGSGICINAITVEDCGPAIVKHTVTLNHNDGETPAGSLTVVDGNAAVKPADPTRGKYTFLGWFVGDTDDEYVWSTAVTGDITLKAHWQYPWTITFDSNGGSAVADVTVKHNTKAEKPTDPTKDANDFMGWFYGDPAVEFDWTKNVTQNYALVAQWQPAVAKYDVEYYDGETKIGTEEQVWANQHPTAAGIETAKPLYTFVGWYLTSALEGDPVVLNTVTPVEGLKLYGKWTKAYATSYDMEAYAVSDGATLETLLSNLDAAGYAYTNVNGIDNGHTHNYIYDGMKYKTNDGDLSFNVNAGKLVIVKIGNLPANALTMYINGVADPTVFVGANEAVERHVNNYFYSADEALYRLDIQASKGTCAIKAVTITDPFTVTFNANGGDDIAAVQGKPSITLPEPTNGIMNFKGWYDAETGGNLIGVAGASYTPTGDIELHAQWEAQSTINTLSDLKVNGETVLGFAANEHTYRMVLPYKSALPMITSATPTNTNATVALWPEDGPEWTDEYDGGCYRQQVVVTPQDPAAEKGYYDIRITYAPKDGVSIIKVATTGGTNKTVTGLYAGEGDVNLSGSKKMDGGKYIGFTLDGTTLQAGDRINVHTTTASTTGGSHIIFYDNMTDKTELYDTEEIGGVGNNIFTINAAMVGNATAYVYRSDADAVHKWNGYIDYIEVTRPMNPVLTAITFDGVAGVIDEANKKVTVELPFSSDVASMIVEPIIAWNAPAETNPIVVNDGGDWVIGDDNTYVLTDKDGDQTTYTITLTQAAASADATLKTLTINGNALTLVDGVYEYDYELPYGTTTAPEVEAEANDANATAGVTSVSLTEAIITVTAENGATQEYVINFTVSRAISYVIYDGSVQESIGSSGTGLINWSLTNPSETKGEKAEVTCNDKYYKKCVKVFSSATKETDRYMTIEVPTGYIAKFYLAGATNSNGNERSLFISKQITGTLDKSIVYSTSSTYEGAAMMSDYQMPGTYYLCSNASIRLYELSVLLYPIDYERPVRQGYYGTICLPNGGVMVGASIFEIAYKDASKIYFDEILNGKMKAGVPYIFLPNEGADKLAVFYTDEANESAGSKNGLFGSYTQELLEPNGNNYILLNNQYCEVIGEAYVGANRAYFQLSGIPTSAPALAPGARRVSMGMAGQNTATGMENVDASAQPVKTIINGQLFILRGEKMYDAQGKLVK